ncbi:MAG TPA: carbohydrate kinase family protein [Thermomicrobiales bacterium]|nr:carbohydrate kinase family protein [Thermomicrobiales bacterium]
MSDAPRIALVGLASWDRLLVLDRFPPPGDQALVRQELSAPGGTTTNTAVALARLGARVRILSAVGDDAAGEQVRHALAGEGVDCAWMLVRAGEPTDLATVLVTDDPPDRTILWHQGAQIVKGDRIDIPALFAHDLVVLDLPDLPLVRFLTDLPAHTAPRARLLGTLTYLADMPPAEAFALALRHDAIVGCERDLLVVAGERDLDGAIAALQRGIRVSNLRTAVITRGAAGTLLVEAGSVEALPAIAVIPVDPTGAGDAFAAGLAYGMALRWPWPRAVRFANVVGGLAVRTLGAQSSLPSLAEAERWMTAPAESDAGGER